MKYFLKSIVWIYLLGATGLQAQSLEALNKFEPWVQANDPRLPEDSALFHALSSDQLDYRGGLIYKADLKERQQFGGISAMEWIDGALLAFSDFSSTGGVAQVQQAKWFVLDVETETMSAQVTRQGYILKEGARLSEIEGVTIRDDQVVFSLDYSRQLYAGSLSAFDTSQGVAVRASVRIPKARPTEGNFGFEAFTTTTEGLFFSVYEKREKKRHHAWLIDPTTGSGKALTICSKLDYIKGATTLSNGDIVIIEKSWRKENNVTDLRISRLHHSDLNNYDIINPQELLRVKSDALDNFEAITSFKAGGEEHLLLMSDDNADGGNAQRTLLLHFVLK